MAHLLLAQFICSGEGFHHSLNEYITFSDLCVTIRRRFRFRASDKFRLHYSSPSCAVIYLDSEEDLKMLFCCARIYKMEHVDVSIVKEVGSGCGSGLLSLEDSVSAVIDENDFLCEPFRDGPKKSYLSDEWSSLITSEGQKFINIDDFRDNLRKYAVGCGFCVILVRNDSNYVHAVCENHGIEKCEWFVHGAVSSINGCFYIRGLNNVHSCKGVLRTQKHRQLGSKIVMNLIETDVSYNLGLKPGDIINKLKSAYGFHISYKVALTSKRKAVEKLYGSDAASFNMLSWYRDVVLDSNPGSSFVLEVDEGTNKFERVFVAYGGQVEGFKYCLPVLYVDGTFGKSIYKGQILSATGRNGNKGFFPLALCICDSETEFNWLFFFKHLKNLLEPQGRVITFISNRGNGLLKAFDIVFTGNPHLYCFKHLTYNLTRRYAGKGHGVVIDKVIGKFCEVAYSSTEKQFYHKLAELREEGGAEIINSFINDIPLEHWCRAFFKGCRYGIMANGIAESFNKWISVERLMPPYAMLDQTRLREMSQMAERSANAESWTTQLTPKMESHLKTEMEKSRNYRVISSQNGVYKVRNDKYSYSVNINEHSCSCVKWQINCFPCPHGLSAIQYASLNVYDFIDRYFHVETYRKSYSFPIHPVSNVDACFSDYSDELILPPSCKRPAGRPKVKRIKSAGENYKKVIQCGRCHKMGNHNKLTCTEPLPG